MFNNSYDYFNSYNMGKIPKPTKANVEIFIANTMKLNHEIFKFESISERPSKWKHSCLRTGVTVLNEQALNYFSCATIYFAICPTCNKVIYYIEV